MKKKECPACAMDIEDSSETCPICGYEFPARTSPVYITIALLLVLLFILFFII